LLLNLTPGSKKNQQRVARSHLLASFARDSVAAASQPVLRQDYQHYRAVNHNTWQLLHRRLATVWPLYACSRFLLGLTSLSLSSDRLPRLSQLNKFLVPRTGFSAQAVAGYVPAFEFFDLLRQRRFPTTLTIRAPERLDYLPEPDIFHDVAGHLPMHMDPVFCDAVAKLGSCAQTAVDVVSEIRDERTRLRTLVSILKGLARFFWFTVEFGLTLEQRHLKAYGSGLLSSYGELLHAFTSPRVQRYPFQLEWVLNQGFAIHQFQPVLFFLPSIDELFVLVETLEQWIHQGRLHNLAPGDPVVSPDDVRSFLGGIKPRGSLARPRCARRSAKRAGQ